jgi:hypothetical protein
MMMMMMMMIMMMMRTRRGMTMMTMLMLVTANSRLYELGLGVAGGGALVSDEAATALVDRAKAAAPPGLIKALVSW